MHFIVQPWWTSSLPRHGQRKLKEYCGTRSGVRPGRYGTPDVSCWMTGNGVDAVPTAHHKPSTWGRNGPTIDFRSVSMGWRDCEGPTAGSGSTTSYGLGVSMWIVAPCPASSVTNALTAHRVGRRAEPPESRTPREANHARGG